MGERYNVRRLYCKKPGYKRLILSNVTLEQAQAHCSDPETSSSTCTNAAGKRRTRQHGPWFDSYDRI
jgi:hypothetical protein